MTTLDFLDALNVVKLLTLLQHQFVFSFLFGLSSDQALSLDRERDQS